VLQQRPVAEQHKPLVPVSTLHIGSVHRGRCCLVHCCWCWHGGFHKIQSYRWIDACALVLGVFHVYSCFIVMCFGHSYCTLQSLVQAQVCSCTHVQGRYNCHALLPCAVAGRRASLGACVPLLGTVCSVCSCSAVKQHYSCRLMRQCAVQCTQEASLQEQTIGGLYSMEQHDAAACNYSKYLCFVNCKLWKCCKR